MMAIAKALDEIKFRIPRQILDKVFSRRDAWSRVMPVSLDESILAMVLRPRVMVDCNLVGGTEAIIDLLGVPREVGDDYTVVYRIDKSRTQGRSIMSVLNIAYGDPSRRGSYATLAASQQSPLLQVANTMMDAVGGAPMTNTASVQLIGENVVLVRDSVSPPPNIFLRCVLANDSNLSHLQLRSFIPFAQLCVLAVKAYIYNNLLIEMDQAALQGGHQLGSIKEQVDRYADADELYLEYLRDKWQKIALMNDNMSWERHIKAIGTGGPR